MNSIDLIEELRELADELNYCPTVGAPPVRALPEAIANRIASAMRLAAERQEDSDVIHRLQ